MKHSLSETKTTRETDVTASVIELDYTPRQSQPELLTAMFRDVDACWCRPD